MTEPTTSLPAPVGETSGRPRPGERLELTIGDLAFGGAGVARRDGFVIFVRGGLPGDRVIAEVTKAKRSFGEATAVELLAGGPDRVPERAPHPGAPWQCLSYEAQLAVKQSQVGDALKRIGGFDLDELAIEPIVAADADATWGYRNKLEYSFGVSAGGELALGFHVAGRWDRIEDVDDIVLASEHANAIRRMVREWCAEQKLDAYDRRTREGFLRNLVIRESARTGQTLVRLVTSPGTLDTDGFAELLAERATSIVWTETAGTAETTRGGVDRQLAGPPWYEEELCGLRFRVSTDAFFQTNTAQAERLYVIAAEYAAIGTRDRVFDLFCGIGTIGLTFAVRATAVWGIEMVEAAVRDATVNARINEIDNAHFIAGDIRTTLRGLVEKAGRPDVCVIDPPRAGLSQKVVRRVLETGAKRIVYVSCNPTTLAPNLRQMVDAGYALRRVRPVDMFPHTPHIECVALLELTDEAPAVDQ